MLTARRPAVTAAPSLRTSLLQWADDTGDLIERRGRVLQLIRLFRRERIIRLSANLAVVAMVLVLPFTAASFGVASSEPAAAGAEYLAVSAAGEGVRAQTASRGLVATGRNPVTTMSAETRPVQHYTVAKGDTLSGIATKFEVPTESLAFANGITDPTTLAIGRELLVPPGEGALYTVRAGDTVESVAARFKVDPAVIMSWNRLYFEPEHFAPGQLIFISGGDVPALVYQTVDRTPLLISRPASPSQVTRSGRIAWPVGGLLTQYYWYGHKGTDIAAPYGTGIAVPEDGVVISTGWVAVGGLSVRVQHDSGLVTGYYHMSSVAVAVGQRVSKGQILGAIGLTGVTTGPHVHWECQSGGVLVDCLAQ